jgi:hypothetical protein
MAKESGLRWSEFNVDNASGIAQDIRNDITNFEFATPYNLQEVTGIDKYAMERLALLADCTGTMNGVFNPAANRAHAVLSGDLRVIRTIDLVVSTKALSTECLISDYSLTRAASGEFTWSAPYSLADGTAPTWS